MTHPTPDELRAMETDELDAAIAVQMRRQGLGEPTE